MQGADGERVVVAQRYELQRELGRGGSATVYLARDLRDESLIALKLLHAEYSGSRAAERFLFEIRLLAEFDHPNILAVLDAGDWNGRPFYTMPFVEGESLQQRIARERRLPVHDVVSMGRTLCDALGYAHARKVVHRDVKPGNIMLAGERVFLTDFGIAKALGPEQGHMHSTTGVARGTRAYMSPEQATADRDIDHRSDIYSLGCVLYEALAGTHPFQSADEVRMLSMRFTERPEPIRRHRDAVPPALEKAILRALERDPADRWQRIEELHDAMVIEAAGGEAAFGNRTATKPAPIPDRLSRRAIVAVAALLVPAAIGAAALINRRMGTSVCAIPTIVGATRIRAYVAATGTSGNAAAGPHAESVEASVRSALAKWSDVDVVTQQGAADASAGGAGDIGCAMQRLQAPIAVIVRETDATSEATAIRIQLTTREVRREADLRIPRDGARGLVPVDSVMLQLLRPVPAAEGASHGDEGSRSFLAWSAFNRGYAFLRSGAIDSAAQALREASRRDPTYTAANAALAIALHLASPADIAEWRTAGTRALADSARLPERDRGLLRAIEARSRSDFASACGTLRSHVSTSKSDYVALLALADCLLFDSTVVVSPRRSPRFATSWEEGRRVLIAAIEAAPSRFARFGFDRLENLAPVSPAVRLGWRPGERTARYAAYPELSGDTLAHAPRARARIHESAADAVPASMGVALQRAKVLHAEYARRWVEREPASGAAHFAFARSLELTGRVSALAGDEPSAWDELEAASRASIDRVSPGAELAMRVRLLTKGGRFPELAQLVDSATRGESGHRSASELAALAPAVLMLGRVTVAAELLQRSALREVPIPMSTALRTNYGRFLALSALTCCGTAADSLERTIRGQLRTELDSLTRRTWEDRLLTRPLMLGAACRNWTPATRTEDSTDVVVRLQRSLARGDTVAVRRGLARIAEDRRFFAPGDIAVDYILQGALLHSAIGDTAESRRQLQRWMEALPVSGALELTEWSQGGALARILAMISRSGAGGGEEGSARELWRGADAWLRKALDRPHDDNTLCALSPSSKEG